MVKLQDIVTKTGSNTNTSSASDQSSSSPTSPLPSPPSSPAQMIPPQLHHHHYPSPQPSSIILPLHHYHPPPPPPPFLFYPPHYFLHYPPTFYPQPQPHIPPDVFYRPQFTPSPNMNAQTPIIRGPRTMPMRMNTTTNIVIKQVPPVKKVWRPRARASSEENNSKINPTNSPQNLQLGKCTTIMLKNIPNNLSRNKLVELLDLHCREQNGKKKKKQDGSSQSQYNFIYLPFDFVRRQNLGYAFVNFTTTEGALTLHSCWNGKGWYMSPKIRNITRAKLQGVYQCRRHFENSVFVCDSGEYLPLEFSPPRNGFNGNTCKAKTIGNWVNANPRRKHADNKRSWDGKTTHPHRLSHSLSK